MDEKKYVLDTFQAHFGSFKNCRMVLYGIGLSTKHIVEHFSEYPIVGLMDEACAGTTIYGKPVLTPDEVVKLGVEMIVVIARSNNVRIIYRRISSFCSLHAIRVYNLQGQLLHNHNQEIKSFDRYLHISERALQEKIARADVVSFDVFDTLIMRRTLYPQDIFYVMESIIKRDGFDCVDFAKTRIQAERALYAKDANPKLGEIYDQIRETLGLSEAAKNAWQELEIRTEREYLIRRERMCAILDFAVSSGKEIYLVSDMYLPERLLRSLLEGMGIHVKHGHLLVSCEYCVSKENGLFDVLRTKTRGKTIVHIGDNVKADDQAARRFHIDDTFPIQSAWVMLEDSYASELLEHTNSLLDRLVIGEFIAKQLNDPFLFSETLGKFRIARNYDMAYSYFSPFIYGYFGWMMERASDLQLDQILFSARDGYLFETISRNLRDKLPGFPKSCYFYTSRAAAVLAGLQQDEDIGFAAQLAYSGSTQQMLKDRFRLADEEIGERGEEEDTEYVMRHREAILKQGNTARRNYRKYLQTLPVKPGDRVGFFDFVSSGTCQKALSKIVDFEMVGLYFCQLVTGSDYQPQTSIEGMYNVRNVYEREWRFMDNYFLLENVLTSYEPTLQAFDENGLPQFGMEYRKEKQFANLREMQQAIIDYMDRINWSVCDVHAIDLAILDLIFHLLNDSTSMMESDYFETEKLVDEFSCRAFDLRTE